MKKWIAVFILVVLVIGVMPDASNAQQSKDFDSKLKTYLGQVSKERGFTVTKADIEYSLALYEFKLTYFDTVQELSDFLGEVIKKDYSNLTVIYEEYQIDKAGLIELLEEYGETLEDYVFIDDLSQAVDFFVEEKIERDPNFDKKLEIYLQEISEIRGFQVTRKHLEEALAVYEGDLVYFKTIDRLSEFLGEVIQKDLGNLVYLYDEYELTEQELREILKENGKNLNDYIFMHDLDYDLISFIGWDYWDEVDLFSEVLALLQQDYDLTDEEIDRLIEHLLSIEEDLMQEDTLDRLFDLAWRLEAFGDFEAVTELTEGQIIELISIYREFLSIFQVKIDFSLIKSGSETSLSVMELFRMNELVNADLRISIYNLEDEFLADLIITGEMVDSEALHKVGGAINNDLTEKPAPAKPLKQLDNAEKVTAKTVTGAKLPKTASDYGTNAMLWLLFTLAGVVMFRKIGKA
ncbi:processed acidic surface protein [Virgibacillus sp. C22-A2]|uniref:Processed acidic surface protein n=1 Tax=Virgibacillus tibetensis TaxID=3042313 RepID=A0ABU6KEZ3_9BACI|nr:processed acidic surface protein [Virgibacillus sp. C22-A2]